MDESNNSENDYIAGNKSIGMAFRTFNKVTTFELDEGYS